MNKVYHVIGLMSGSSLDGLDICLVEFKIDSPSSMVDRDSTMDVRPSTIDFKIIQAECIPYEASLRDRIKNAAASSAFELAELHTGLGKYFGRLTREFMERNEVGKIDLICSHGQTIFHQPLIGFTTQIGCGAQIAAQTNCKVVCDLRSIDIAYGGQGAPIVPIAEKYLFSDYNAFLNLGGIANISFHKSESESESESGIVAYDVCAANTLLNHLAQQKEMEYDANGDLARAGKIIPPLLDELNNIEFCKQSPPKSLGTEHVMNDWIKLADHYDNRVEDKLATCVEHIAIQISGQINSKFKIQNSKLLVTGGGALNTFLIERIQSNTPIKAVVPDELTIQFKEALAMALIGLLRVLEIPNVLSSVTGAEKDTISGAVYLP